MHVLNDWQYKTHFKTLMEYYYTSHEIYSVDTLWSSVEQRNMFFITLT